MITTIEAFYAGKVVRMDYITAKPGEANKALAKRRFHFACMRITDNNCDGYVIDGDASDGNDLCLVFRVTRGKRTAVHVTGEECEKVLAIMVDVGTLRAVGQPTVALVVTNFQRGCEVPTACDAEYLAEKLRMNMADAEPLWRIMRWFADGEVRP